MSDRVLNTPIRHEKDSRHTNTPRVFHVETSWKQPFSRRFKWNTCGVFVGSPW